MAGTLNVANMDIKDRTFLVTGGTSGVGKATALGLARVGAKVVIISRSAARGQGIVNEIAQTTGNERCEFLVADLALQSSIRSVSEEFKRKYDNLHVLANLSGAVYLEKQLTAEGIERMFAVNYLSHFLLTSQLLDMLQASPPARVITVLGAARFLKKPSINFEDIQFKNHFNGMGALAQALFAKTFFTFELAKRLQGTGVTAVAFHPGFVKSNLGRELPWYLRILAPPVNLFAKNICDIGVYLAASRDVEKISGAFFNDNMQIVPLHQQYDEATGRKLWSISEELAGISPV